MEEATETALVSSSLSSLTTKKKDTSTEERENTDLVGATAATTRGENNNKKNNVDNNKNIESSNNEPPPPAEAMATGPGNNSLSLHEEENDNKKKNDGEMENGERNIIPDSTTTATTGLIPPVAPTSDEPIKRATTTTTTTISDDEEEPRATATTAPKDDDAGIVSGTTANVNRHHPHHQQQQHVRRRTTSTDSSGAFSVLSATRSSGSLATDLSVAEKHMNESHCVHSEVRDPILEAVAKGAAVRQSKQQQQLLLRRQHDRTMTKEQHTQISTTTTTTTTTTNDWKLSLGRLAKAAMSTAKTAVHVTTPLLDEARNTVVSSASGFAHDVQEEWQKQQQQEQQKQDQEQRQQQKPDQEQRQQQRPTDDLPPVVRGQDKTMKVLTENIDDGTTIDVDLSNDVEKSSGNGLSKQEHKTDETITATDTQQIQTKAGNDNGMELIQQEDDPPSATNETIVTKTADAISVSNPILETSNSLLAETSENKVELTTTVSLDDEEKLKNEGNHFAANIMEDPPNLANANTKKTEKLDEDPTEETMSQQLKQEDALLLVGDTSTPTTLSDGTTESHSVENKQGEESNKQSLELGTGNAGITIDTVTDKKVKSLDPSTGAAEDSTATLKVESLNGILLADRNLSTDTDDGIDPAIRALFESTGAALDAATAEIGLNDDCGKVDGERNNSIVANTAIVDDSHDPNKAAVPVETDHTIIDVDSHSNPSEVQKANGDKKTTEDMVIDVGSLAIYEDGVPESFARATQAVRNYHANVQTLEKCETEEQKETCRSICDETYRLACQMVAQQNHMESPESEKYQMGLLDDLRKLRELQKTTFAVEEGTSNNVDLDADVDEQANIHGVADKNKNDIGVPETPKEAQDIGMYKSITDTKLGSTAGDVRVQDNDKLVVSTSGVSVKDSTIDESSNQFTDSIREEPKDYINMEQSSKALEENDGTFVKTQSSPAPTTTALFSETEDGIYEQSADTATPTPVVEELKSREESPEMGFSIVKDRKTFVKYLVSSLTGFDVEIKDRPPETHLTDPTSIRNSSMPTSIFDNLNDSGDEMSSIASPPEVEVSDQDDMQSARDETREDDFAVIDSTFDLVPPRHKIANLKNVSEVVAIDVSESKKAEDENAVESDAEIKVPPLKKQRSFASLHNSTENNSVPSLSPRRKTKRFGKTHSSRSGFNKSPRLTPKMPLSPLDTPVESRSIGVEDDQLHASSNSGVGLGRVIVDWDADAMKNHPSVPDTEEMTDALDRQGLDETLLGFSSLDDGNFLSKLSKCDTLDSNTTTSSSLLWKQLLANWKHREAWKSASNCPFLPLSPDAAIASRPLFEDNDDSTSGKTINFRIHEKMLSFSSGIMSEIVPPLIGDMCRQVESSDQLGLTRFLCDIGPDDLHSPKSNHMLRHTESAIFERNEDESPNISSSLLLQSARRELSRFTKLVESIVTYASLNESHSDFEMHHIAFTTGTKDIQSIDEKSKRKYDGDLLQVKDVLRGQIIFPDEHSLLCGLYQLHQHSRACKSTGENDLSFEIVRLKNMFQTTGAGNDTKCPLPTGYRHILINIRLESGLLAELQFQLSQFFWIMGEEGYLLHAMLTSKMVSNEESYLMPHHTESAEDISSILSLPFMKDSWQPTSGVSKVTIELESKQTPVFNSNLGMENDAKSNPAAAAAASKTPKKNNSSVGSSDSKPNPFAGGGIAAAAAAAAAAAKSQQKETSETTPTAKPNPFAGGGIAAAAAAAAAAKSQQKETSETTPTSKPNPFAGGGIAAAAAAAAAVNSQKQDIGNKAVLGGSSTRRCDGNFEEEKKSDTLSVNLNRSMSPDQKTEQSHTDSKLHSMKTVSSEVNMSDTSVSQSMRNQILAVFNAGVEDAMSNPRDLASFCCLYLLATRIRETRYAEPTDDGRVQAKSIIDEYDLSTVSEKFLLRSLAIGNQATSVGMVGWLEYGSSNPLDRTASILCDVQHKMACFMAEQNDWSKAIGVLSALVLRCRRQLSPFHPKTLCAMLDLAGAFGEIGDERSASLVLRRVQDAVKSFLSAFENLQFCHSSQNIDSDSHFHKVVVNDDCIDSIHVLRQFAVGFQRELCRDFLDCLGRGHPTALWSHSLTADSLSVLSNCLRMKEDGPEQTVDVNHDDIRGSAYYSALAYRHYKISFSGWTKKEGLSGLNAASAALSLSRHLREMDKLSQAMKILEAVASCFEKEVDALIKHERTPGKSDNARNTGVVTTQAGGSLESRTRSEVVHFLPLTASNRVPSLLSKSRRARIPVPSIGASFQREQLSVACLWMMAVLTMEQSGDDERGRYRALSLLHTASSSMKRVLQDEGLDDDTRTVCLDIYRCIDDEARLLFEPVNELVVKSNDKVSRKQETGPKTVEFRI